METPDQSDQLPEEGQPEATPDDSTGEHGTENPGVPGEEETGTGNPDAAGAEDGEPRGRRRVRPTTALRGRVRSSVLTSGSPPTSKQDARSAKRPK